MIYLDNAATTYPKPEQVYDSIMDCMKNYCANPGRAGHKMAMRAAREIYDARENIAKLFNIDNPMNIIFTNNATDSLNLAIKGVVKEGDHIITTSMEHNSVIRPIKSLEARGISNTIVNCDKEGFLDVNDIKNAIKPNTKLIVTTHASNVVGTLVDIKAVGEIAKENNILYLVDASQTAGVYSIDVKDMNVDMIAAPGHKCLLGPQGTGILYIREGLSVDILKEGGTGSKSEDLFQPEIVPDRYESGTHNTPGIAGLNEGVKFILEKGIDDIRLHEEELCQYMLDKLEEIPQDKPINNNIINNHFRNDEKIKEALKRSLDKAETKAKSKASRNKPIQTLDKVADFLDTIDTNIFMKYNDEEKSEIITKVEIIKNVLDKIKEDANV